MAEVRKFLAAVREHTGLFVERAPRRYGFMHLTFEEYYVARYLVARSKTRAKLIRQHLHQPRWEEPILLALGFVGLEYPAEASELVETAILAEGEEAIELGFTPSEHEDLLGRDYLFALRCLGDNIPVHAKLLKRLIDRLAHELLHRIGSARFQRYEQVLRERLAYLRGSAGAYILLPLLVTALYDVKANIRFAAGRSLGQLGQSSPEAITALITALHDAEASVRSAAAWSLGQLGQTSPEVNTALLITLHDAHASVRSAGAASLGQLGQASPETTTALLTALHDADADVRSIAARSLTQLSQTSPEVTDGLREGLLKASRPIRRDSAHVLGQIGQADKATLNAVWHGMLDDDNDVRTASAQALARLGRRFPTIRQSLEARFVEAIRDAKFDEPYKYGRHQAYDYAYEGLWLLVVGGELEEA